MTMNYINISRKKLVGRNNQVCRPLTIDYSTVEQVSFTFIDDNNKIIELSPELSGMYLAGSLQTSMPSYDLLFLSKDYTISNNVISFVLDTYTTNFLTKIKKPNTEIFLELGQIDLNTKHVSLRDKAYAFPRVYVQGLSPQEIDSHDYYTKTETDERISEEVEPVLEALQEHVTNEEIHVSVEEKNTWNAKAEISDIPTKVSELENDSDFQTAEQVSETVETATSEKADTADLIAHTSNSDIHVTLSDKTAWNAKADISDIPTKTSDLENDSDFVNATQMGEAIEAVEARQLYATNTQGSFATLAALTSATSFYKANGTQTTPTENDIAYVLSDETHSNKSAKYTVSAIEEGSPVWGFVITFSDNTFTQAQMDAINSGIDSEKVEEFSNKQDKITAENKLDYALLSGTPEIPSPEWGSISGSIENQTDLKNALDLKADKTDLDDEVETLTNAFIYLNATISGYNGQLQPNNEVWYWAPEKVVLQDETNIIEHTFADGKGILKFEAPVTSFSFQLGNSGINNVHFPDTLVSIGSYAFERCSGLVTMELPAGVTSIGEAGFVDCINLVSIVLPTQINEIKEFTFQNCPSLVSIEIPDGVTLIGDDAFEYCHGLASIKFPSRLSIIKEWAFAECSSLTSIEFPSELLSIEEYAFTECSSLRSLRFNGSPEMIDSDAFESCDNLTDIYVPWSEGEVAGAPWGAINATIHYNSVN